METQKDLYFNGEAIVTTYQPAAHTDGDSVVFFRRSDVLVTGDVFDTTRFPVIDLDKGRQHPGRHRRLNRIIGITVPPVPLSGRRAAPSSSPATAPSATRPTSSTTATWSRSSATACRT